MDDYALVLNAGSSSLKVLRFPAAGWRNAGDWKRGARSRASAHRPDCPSRAPTARSLRTNNWPLPVRDGRDAIDALAAWLKSKYGGARVLGVGHRVVHGGPRFDRPTIVNEQVLAELHDLIPLAPLHQPYNLLAIEAAAERLPGVPQVACFDTSFHRGHAPRGRTGAATARALQIRS